MKNILTSAGVAALAVAGFQTTCAAQSITVDDAKWWQVSASLRGFYDDNTTTAPKDQELESFGFEIRPGFDVGHKGEQHIIKLSTQYSARWFEAREDSEWDHNFLADLAAEFQASENHVVRLNDTFSYASEDSILERNGVITAPTVRRSDGTNIRNNGELKYVGQFTRLFGLELGYQNLFYDFDQAGPGSYSALLDRMEHTLRGETRWTLSPTLAGVLGYWYERVNFTSDDFLGPLSPFTSEVRDSESHYFVGGVDYTVSPHCFVSLRGGAQNVTYVNLTNEPDEWNAFGDVSTTFEYSEGSYFRLGGKYGRYRTDVVGAFFTESDLTLDQESITVYGTVNHKLADRLTARGSGQVQFGTFQGGVSDDQSEGLYIFGVSLTYDLTEFLALETGYNYDRLDSDQSGRSYTRNRVFVGVRGQF